MPKVYIYLRIKTSKQLTKNGLLIRTDVVRQELQLYRKMDQIMNMRNDLHINAYLLSFKLILNVTYMYIDCK